MREALVEQSEAFYGRGSIALIDPIFQGTGEQWMSLGVAGDKLGESSAASYHTPPSRNSLCHWEVLENPQEVLLEHHEGLWDGETEH